MRCRLACDTVEVSTHVVGATTQPEPVSLEVEVQCPDIEQRRRLRAGKGERRSAGRRRVDAGAHTTEFAAAAR
jgi:hypothetical protein